MGKSLIYTAGIFFALILVFISASSYAQTLTVPATSNTGTFTISYSVSPGGGTVEELQSGNWVQVGGGSSSGSFSLTRSNGSYSYRLKQCYSGPCNVVRSASIVVSISSSSSSSSSSSLPAPATIQVPTGDIDGQFSVQWSSVSGASFYVLEQLKSGGSYSEVYRGSEIVYAALIDPGSYKFQVKACRSTADCSGYKESTFVSVVGSNPGTTRRVVFLHTDLLGSPAAETNENGLENE